MHLEQELLRNYDKNKKRIMKKYKTIEKGISHLDLHGIKHNDVDNEILDFIFQHQDQLPLIIICGEVILGVRYFV